MNCQPGNIYVVQFYKKKMATNAGTIMNKMLTCNVDAPLFFAGVPVAEGLEPDDAVADADADAETEAAASYGKLALMQPFSRIGK